MYAADDEISLMDIYQFLKEGWTTIALTTALGGALGIGASVVLPEKFLASVLIQPARALGSEVESITVLAEKMRSPTYYSQVTFAACGVDGDLDPAKKIATELKPNVPKNSAFVSISYKSKSTSISLACLTAVLDDINKAHAIIKTPMLEKANNDLIQTKQKFETSKIRHQQELKNNKEQLESLKQKLKTAQQFINRFDSNTARFNFKDDQFSASSLLLATIIAKQNEVKDFQVQINNFEMKDAASLSGREDELLNLEKQINDSQRNLLAPVTTPAVFATPIYMPAVKVEPNRSLITVISILVGGFTGLMLLIFRRAIKNNQNKSIS